MPAICLHFQIIMVCCSPPKIKTMIYTLKSIVPSSGREAGGSKAATTSFFSSYSASPEMKIKPVNV